MFGHIIVLHTVKNKQIRVYLIEPSHEIMALFVLCKLILQTRVCSHPVEIDVWFLVGPFVYFHTSCVRIAKALARLRGWAGSLEPSLVAYVISTIMSWTGWTDRNFQGSKWFSKIQKFNTTLYLEVGKEKNDCSCYEKWFWFGNLQPSQLYFGHFEPVS